MAKLQLENMTFAELNCFTEEWFIKSGEDIERFHLQLSDANNWFKVVDRNNRKCNQINNRLNYSFAIFKIIELITAVNENYLSLLEKHVLILEKKSQVLYRADVAQDKLRGKLYRNITEISDTVNSINAQLEAFYLETIQNEAQLMKDPAELVARILMMQLYNLENIESNMYLMLNYIQLNDCKFKHLRCNCLNTRVNRYKSK